MSAQNASKELLHPHPFLRKAREAAGLSQEDLEALSSVSRSTIGKVERVNYRCRPELQVLIAQALGKDVEDLWPPQMYPPRIDQEKLPEPHTEPIACQETCV